MSNTNFKFVIGSKPLSNGDYGVYLRVTKNRRKKEIYLNIRVAEENFINEKFSKKHKGYKLDTELLAKYKNKAFEVLRAFEINGEDFTLLDFARKFKNGDEQREQINLLDFFDEIIKEMNYSDRIGNAKVYSETKRTLVKFGGTQILLKDVTVEFLDRFEAFMRANGNADSGIALKMRQLRAVCNKALQRKKASRDWYPFDGYKIARLKTRKNKIALSEEDFKKIKDVDLSTRPDLLDSYNYAMFSFYARGMNFADMAVLTWSDIIDGRIHYVRSKTKGQFNVKVIGMVKDILNYYKSQVRPTKYVFPILLKEDLTPQQIFNRRHKVSGRFNRHLKEIAKIAGVSKNITVYTFRHSYATLLKQKGIGTDVISELMGHSDVQVTKSYLKEFDDKFLDEKNSVLLDI